MALPIARCVDCLYWAEEAGVLASLGERIGYCRIRVMETQRLVTEDFWCGEFIHRELGGQNQGKISCFDENGVPHYTTQKRWRFPTEQE